MSGAEYTVKIIGNAADQLRAYVRRIEKIEEAIAELNGDKTSIYSEAKACGFDLPTLRKLVQRRRKRREDLVDADETLEAYEGIMEGNNSSPPARKKLLYGPDIEQI